MNITTLLRSEAAQAGAVDMQLEIVVITVADVDPRQEIIGGGAALS
jgi:hypothetical protein